VGVSETKGGDYTKVTPPIVGIVNNLQQEIDRLRALNARLVTELHDLLYHIDHGMLPINTDRSHGVLREAKAEREG
jgi:hypothetical protein